MGKITSSKLANGNIGLEITYGGADALFGGVDTSAPPAYIDPRCFTASEGALVVDNRLCAIALEQLAIPALWNHTANVKLIGFGTFYSSTYGQLNYALGYIATPFGSLGTTPTGVTYSFYITSWDPNIGTPNNDVLPVTIYDSYTPANAASLTLPCVASSATQPSAGSGATGTANVPSNGFPTAASLTGGTGYGVGDAVQFLPTGAPTPGDIGWIIVDTIGGGGSILTSHLAPNSGFGYPVGASVPIQAGSVYVASQTTLKINGTAYNASAYTGGATEASIVASLVTSINASDPNVSAAASVDGDSIILTARTPGAAGNSITVQDASTAASPSNPPPFYFPCTTIVTLEGGSDAVLAQALRTLSPVSSTSEGGTIYFANLGPLILQYAGPGKFSIATMYQGVAILRKFAGSLIGAGVIPALGFEIQDQDMIFAWSADSEPTIWNPVDGSGNVTGAGFEQLADIGEFLSGLIVCNGTCYILRKEGVSYATATGNGLEPFSVNHIGLGEQGEGTQVPSLVTQYDSVGCYVGNSDVWQISGSISSIGQKIKAALFAQLQNLAIAATQIGSGSASVFIGGDEFPIAMFVIGNMMFIFNSANGTWMTLSLKSGFPLVSQILCVPLVNTNVEQSTGQYGQALLALVVQFVTLAAPTVYYLTEQLSDGAAVSNTFKVTFPAEEVSFGRDITIDALYLAIQGKLGVNCTLNAYINGVLYATTTLQGTQFTNVNNTPVAFQLFPQTSTGIFSAKSPQLTLELINPTGNWSSQVRFTKVSMFGSFDPTQRPV